MKKEAIQNKEGATSMTVDRRVNSIESSFKMESISNGLSNSVIAGIVYWMIRILLGYDYHNGNGNNKPTPLTLVEAKTYDSGAVLIHYKTK